MITVFTWHVKESLFPLHPTLLYFPVFTNTIVSYTNSKAIIGTQISLLPISLDQQKTLYRIPILFSDFKVPLKGCLSLMVYTQWKCTFYGSISKCLQFIPGCIHFESNLRSLSVFKPVSLRPLRQLTKILKPIKSITLTIKASIQCLGWFTTELTLQVSRAGNFLWIWFYSITISKSHSGFIFLFTKRIGTYKQKMKTNDWHPTFTSNGRHRTSRYSVKHPRYFTVSFIFPHKRLISLTPHNNKVITWACWK